MREQCLQAPPVALPSCHRKATTSTELVGRRDLGPTTRTGVGRHLLRLCLDLSDLGTNLTALDITLRDAVIEGLPPGAQLRIILGDIIEACTKLSDETLSTPLDLVQLGVKLHRARGASNGSLRVAEGIAQII